MENSILAAKVAVYGVIACWWGFALTFWMVRRSPFTREVKRERSSYLGFFLQALGYLLVWSDRLRRPAFTPMSGPEWLGWIIAIVAIVIAALSVVLVVWAARCLGKQWSLGARLVEGHDLIQDGPYRFVRNPIYTGMFGMLVATGLANASWPTLLIAMAVFLVGTWIRIRIEERLLRTAFGDRHKEYARRVSALIPGIY